MGCGEGAEQLCLPCGDITRDVSKNKNEIQVLKKKLAHIK